MHRKLLRWGWVGLLIMATGALSAQSWAELLPSIRKQFPQVRQLTTADLAAWLQSTNRVPPILIDVRAREEFDVSHLPGAQRAQSLREVRRIVGSNSQPVVLYCSVGYRSSDLATRLLKAGITNVFNLEGSIFAWANEKRPVVCGKREVKAVHPYDEKWGQLLAPSYRSYEPK